MNRVPKIIDSSMKPSSKRPLLQLISPDPSALRRLQAGQEVDEAARGVFAHPHESRTENHRFINETIWQTAVIKTSIRFDK